MRGSSSTTSATGRTGRAEGGSGGCAEGAGTSGGRLKVVRARQVTESKERENWDGGEEVEVACFAHHSALEHAETVTASQYAFYASSRIEDFEANPPFCLPLFPLLILRPPASSPPVTKQVSRQSKEEKGIARKQQGIDARRGQSLHKENSESSGGEGENDSGSAGRHGGVGGGSGGEHPGDS
jgi:hypothetical protein